MLRSDEFPEKHLIVIRSAESFRDPREPPLFTGNFVTLNSGGPRMLVVEECDAERVVVAWRDVSGAVHEQQFPRVCLHRID